jgi:hypothetical protein
MITIPLQLPDQLARQVLPLQDQLPEIIEVGLRHWKKQPPQPITPRERVEQVWEAAGLIEPATSSSNGPATRRTPIEAGGQPASEIIIEQRGIL